jgi:hypothetical protein
MASLIVPVWTRETSWRQGHVLLPETVSALNLQHQESPDETCVVVVSHDCDIAQDNLVTEPHVEVIIGRRLARVDNNYTLTKNPRILHLEMSRSGTVTAIALDATGKRSVRKDKLAEWTHDSGYLLTAPDLVILKKWLGVRYNRAAFPNEFERRLTDLDLKAKIEKALRPANKIISAIYFKLDTFDEMRSTDSTPYELTIVLLYEPGRDPDKAAGQADKVALQISSDFEARCYIEATDTWEYLKLKSCLAISEEDASVAQVKELQQWRLDQWSFKPGVTVALPPTLDT